MSTDDLVDRLARATGPDRDLDIEIWLAVEPLQSGWSEAGHRVLAKYAAKHFTGSIDAALTLKRPEHCVEMFTGRDGETPSAIVWGEDGAERLADVEAATLPLAICAALLAARHDSEG